MSVKKIYLLALLSGILLGLTYPPFPLGILAFFGFVPLLKALEEKRTIGQTLSLLYLCFFVYHGIANWWVGSWQPEADPYLLASGIALWLGHPFFFMVPVAGYLFLKKTMGRERALWCFPLLWTAFEWLHGLGEFSYPWVSLGYSQIYHTYWVQIADIGGIWCITFVIVLVNSLISQIYFSFKENAANEARSGFFKTPFAFKRILAIACCIIAPIIYSQIKLVEYSHNNLLKNSPRKISVGIIQPNINPWRKWGDDPNARIEQLYMHQRIQDSLRYSAGGRLDMTVWSETSIPMYILTPQEYFYFHPLKNWIDTSETALLSGFPDLFFYEDSFKAPPSSKQMNDGSGQRYDTYNAAFLLNPYASEPQTYRKMKLTPFAERVPYADEFSFALSLFEWGVGISGYGKGPKQETMILKTKNGNVELGSIICIESIYPDFVRNFVVQGAELLTIITNDAWFDHTPGPEQHYQIGAMRAIENRRYIARCGNTGVSGFITPTGNSLKRAPQYTAVGIAETLPLLKDRSIYTRFGDWLPQLCTGVSVLTLLAGVFLKRKKAF
ncbi:MAG TPA: apolipoprotein N-acyltransferase [Patescibacteria group bacterium]|nr:apolipoprotein N-acyltransferase [Patescibacteria group bacterium]